MFPFPKQQGLAPPQSPAAPAVPGADEQQLMELMAQLGGFDDQNALYKDQLGQAQQLMQPGPAHHTPGGALTGGLADLLNQTTGQLQQNQIHGKQQAMVDKSQGALADFMRTLHGSKAPATAQQPQDFESLIASLFG